MRTVNANMVATANARETFKQWLFQLDSPGGFLYFAMARQDVSYMGQTWKAWPIEFSGITEDIKGQVNGLTLKVGNVTEEISAILELNDALRNVKVHVFCVMDLEDPQAYLEDVYYIDAAKVGKQAAEFTLSTRLALLEASIAPRMYARAYCRWRYKGRGCWGGTGPNWTQPSGWTLGGGSDTCGFTPDECRRHGNIQRIGCFPSVPGTKVIKSQ